MHVYVHIKIYMKYLHYLVLIKQRMKEYNFSTVLLVLQLTQRVMNCEINLKHVKYEAGPRAWQKIH